MLCFDTAVDAERFCQEKSAIFVVMPEENPNAYFMISLLIQQLYREILSVADENGGKLPNRVMFYCDEFGTMPPIQSAEMMYSASRSRRLSIVSIIQSYQQLKKTMAGKVPLSFRITARSRLPAVLPRPRKRRILFPRRWAAEQC